MTERISRGGSSIVLLVSVLLLTTAFVMTVAANSPEEITECIEIDAPGTYELQNNVSSDGTCFEITADDVVFDGQGHTITGGDDGFGQVPAMTVFGDDNVTVTDVAIDGDSDVGVSVSNIEHVFLANITADGPGLGLNGISVDNTANITLQDVDVTGYRGSITLTATDGFTIESTSLEGGIHDGIELLGASNGTIQDVVGVDKGDSVVAVPDTMMGITSNVTMDNVTAKESGMGVHLESGDVWEISITNSTAIDNDGSGFVLGAEDVSLSDSQATRNGEYGILLDETSDTVITNVDARENTANALRVDGSPDVSVEKLDIGDSTAANTTLSIAEATDIELGGTTAPGNSLPDLISIHRYFQVESVSEESALTVSVQYNSSDVTEVNESTLSMWAYDGEWSEYEGTTVDTDEQSITGVLESFSTVGVFGEEKEELSPSFTFEPDEPEVGDQVTFNASESSSPNGEIVEYRWNFTGDSEFDHTTADPETTWTYSDTNEYHVVLEIEDEAGVKATVERDVVVTESDDDPEANLIVVAASLDETDVVVGDTVTVTAEITNDGDGEGVHTAELEIDGVVKSDESVTVKPGETETVEFTYTFEDVGEYEIAVDGVTGGLVTVSEPSTSPPPTPSPEPDIAVSSASLDETAVAIHDTVNVTVVLENSGDADGEHELSMTVGSDSVATETVSVDAGETAELSLAHTFDVAGEFEVRVDDVEAGTVTVSAADHSPAEFQVSDLTPAVDIDEPGEAASISATIENVGNETDTQTVEGTLDGETVFEETLTLEEGESHTVTIDLETAALEYSRSYEYTIRTDDGTATGVLTVGPEPEPGGDEDDTTEEEAADGEREDDTTEEGTVEDESEDDTTEEGAVEDDTADEEGPGFGVVVALVASLMAVLLVRR